MPDRLRVLISAYACEPGKGSEPEIGWKLALHMARWHDVTVLTRANNRKAIEAAVAGLPDGCPRPHFEYLDAAAPILRLKRLVKSRQWYYILWQRLAQRTIRRLHRAKPFDVLHHLTFAAFRYRAAVWNCGVPVVWGPVGGMESVPWRLLPLRYPKTLLHECIRNLDNWLQRFPGSKLRRGARRSRVTLCASGETYDAVRRLEACCQLMPGIGVDEQMLDCSPLPARPGPLRLLYVGNLQWLKGFEFAIPALASAGVDAEWTLIGDGPFQREIVRLAEKHGVAGRLRWKGRLPRNEVERLYREHDVFLFPSLHDSGGFAVLEAMAHALPVICLDAGGPAVSVSRGCGIRVPLGSRQDVIAGLAEAIRTYAADPELLRRDGVNASLLVKERFTWNRKAEAVARIYAEAAGGGSRP